MGVVMKAPNHTPNRSKFFPELKFALISTIFPVTLLTSGRTWCQRGVRTEVSTFIVDRMTTLEVLPTGLKEVVKDDESGLEVRIYYLECLAQATYIIMHEDSAFIIDPRRDVDAFIQELKNANKHLKGILETHFHADFVSGHLELKQKTGAPIYFGPTAAARCEFEQHELKDGEIIPFTSCYDIKTLHTPGHTTESVVYLLVDKRNNNRPLKAFTGDTLFIGSCGRPDLVGSVGYTSHQMATMMFYSLMDKIVTLSDDVQIFPAHGAGSPCGKNLSSDLHSTIGKEKRTNAALQYNDVTAFRDFLTSGQPSAPGYFSHDVETNTIGAPMLSEVLKKIPRLSATEFSRLCETKKHPIIDTRSPAMFNDGYINRSINMPLGEAGGTIVGVEDGNFAMWVGTLFSFKRQLLLVCCPEKVCESLQRLARIGYTNIIGILEGGINEWRSQDLPLLTNKRISVKSDHSALVTGKYTIIDVRTCGEYETNTCQGALNIPLAEIYHKLDLFEKDKKYIAFCKSGYRSIIGSSILRAEGYDVGDIYGGFATISVYCPEITTTKQVCPSMKAMVAELERDV